MVIESIAIKERKGRLMYQVRFDGGNIIGYGTLGEALNHSDGKWDKVSWTVNETDRLILRRNGAWELWTVESLKREAAASMPQPP